MTDTEAPSLLPCPHCNGSGKTPAAISGETHGPSIDAERRRNARDNPVICWSCHGTGKQTFDPATIGMTLAADEQTLADVGRIEAKAVVAEHKLNTGAFATPPSEALGEEIRKLARELREKAEAVLSDLILLADADPVTKRRFEMNCKFWGDFIRLCNAVLGEGK